MARFDKNLDELVERICKLHLREWVGGTATGGSTSTVADTDNLNQEDDYFNNYPQAEVHIRSTTDGAAPVGETRNISDFVQTSGTITVSDVFSATVASGDTYSVHMEYPWTEIVEAINASIDDAADFALIDKIDETSITLVSAVYEYDIPTDFTHIYRLTMADNNGNFYKNPVPVQQYKILRAGATPKIHFSQMPDSAAPTDHYYGQLWSNVDFTADRKVRIEGLRRQPNLVNSGDVCYLNPTFVCAQAAAYLHSARIYRSDVDPDEHRTQFVVQQDLADRASERMAPQFPPNIKRVET